ncbi:type VI secretion system baseplate subunit TssE [Massilia sp. YIM B02763]|uniref:type VI secretion system baseplate subunit TssE n=1 Tax=Massilia sp. YIM B02763 TaxID=3050130 RepID=UPI0025B6C727|nr:type VI secretion system baseplate subunit TssE [Massilia sp. YIM B02763]MDN4056171.1 type VI secretion system baseplate subunit TssE [Massilia sp. YIM B02763]
MTSWQSGLLERLMGERAQAQSLEALKDSIVRELDALLNTRAGLAPGRLAAWPQARASVLDYGLADFAAFSLASSEDRAAICASLKAAIERHEPRLVNVSATLETATSGVNRLHFTIDATLRAADGNGAGAGETVHFNAVLQPSSLHYTIGKAGRPPRG